jgi:glycosyltransferase involved in cell wall biosynthesis
MIVLIPAYGPDHRLTGLVDALLDAAPDLRVVVVDDGSGPTHQAVFDAVRARGCAVLRHPVNRGKGCALKTGFRHIAAEHPGEDVVCADSDGQHTVVDVLRVAERVRTSGTPWAGRSDEVASARPWRMVLGARRFAGPVPLRSRFGNAVTRVLFAAATGRRVQDTQTGLRGYPAASLDWLCAVPGERFEYEMNVLLRAARSGRAIVETDIATIYLEHNASSHFRPVVDSARIYTPLLAFSVSSLLAFVVDTVALVVLFTMTGALLPSVVGARALSSALNFAVNRRYVFGGATARPLRSAAVRYWSLVVTLLAANYVLVAGLAGAGFGILAAKLVTETVLFVASYLVQRLVVFVRPAGRPEPASSIVVTARR